MARQIVSMKKLADAHEALQSAVDMLAYALSTDTEIGLPMIRLSVDLPEDVHIKLKTRCAARHQKMGEAVRAMIERDLMEAA